MIHYKYATVLAKIYMYIVYDKFIVIILMNSYEVTLHSILITDIVALCLDHNVQ